VEECDVNATSAESIIRQVLYGNHYFRTELGQASEEFMLPDCFGFPASLPSLLAHCGLKGFSTQKLSWGSAMGIPFNVGVWEGLDGVSLLAALNPGSYGSQITSDLARNEDWLKRIQADGQTTGLYKDYMYYGTGDIGGAPTQETVYWLEQSIKSDGPLRVLPTRADQLFQDIKPEQVKNLPRYKGDLELTQHSAGSITSAAYMKRWNRKNELLADSAERAAVTASMLGGMEYPQKQLNDAWTLVLGGTFHDILPGTSLPQAYQYSWNDEVLALNQFADTLQSAVSAVASGLDTTGDGEAVVVYNPLSIARQDMVEISVPCAADAPQTAVEVTNSSGERCPAQLAGINAGMAKIVFLAGAPPMGFEVYNLKLVDSVPYGSPVLSVSESMLSNEYYKVSLDQNGDVASIYDKQAKRELLASPIRLAFTSDAPGYWPAWNMDWADAQKPPRGYVGGPAQISITERGPARVALTITRDAEGSRFAQTITLAAGTSGQRVEFHNTIDWRSTGCNLKAEFPLSVSNPQATYNWEVGTLKRSNNDEKKYEVPSHQWFDLTDTGGDYGVTVLSPCKYASDKPNDNTLRLTLLRTPGVHSDDYADQSTQDWGRHEITYGLAAHGGDWNAGRTDWQAMRLEQPLVSFNSAKHTGALGKSYSPLMLDNDRVRVMAVKRAEDSDEVIVRLVSLTDKPLPDVTLVFAAPILAAREVNGQEQTIGEAKFEHHALPLEFTPYQLRTFAVKLGEPAVMLGSSTSQPVTLPYNASIASRDDQVATDGFDGDRRCLAAEMLPAQIINAGVTFKLAPAGDNQPHAVRCAGQVIALPAGQFNRLYLLAAAASGNQTAEFKVDGRPCSLMIQDWGAFIGQWDTRIWKSGIPEVAFDWPYQLDNLSPGYIKRTPVAWYCSHRHNASGQNEIYEYTYIYRYAIDIPANAKELLLPQNDKICILAASVAKDNAAALTPAQPLYDTLEDHAGLELALKP
jgi:alpha-mannosidase